MLKKMRVGILGIGGVGGYFGSLLVDYYAQSEFYEIIFIARNESLKQISENGLKIIKEDAEKTVYPSLVSDNIDLIGELDYLIISTKSYDLISSLKAYKKCLKKESIIIPLLNGVEAKALIKKEFNNLEVWDACVYIVARIISPGVISVKGKNQLFYFGSKLANESKLKEFEKFLKDASVIVELSDNIEQTIWEKYIFISSIASLTSYLNKSIGEILSNEEYKQSLINLLTEIINLAKVKSINLSDQFMETVLERMKKLPAETTSSMHYDFINKKKTEFQTLTEYVVKESTFFKMASPEYLKILNYLQLNALN